jgi:hypothetical protein
MTSTTGNLHELRCAPLDPSVDGDVSGVQSTLGEELFDVAVGQAITQVPTHRDRDHLAWEPEASERRR